MSLRDTDPDNFRGTAAIGLVESLSKKSDINIGVIAFNDRSRLIQPLTGSSRSGDCGTGRAETFRRHQSG